MAHLRIKSQISRSRAERAEQRRAERAGWLTLTALSERAEHAARSVCRGAYRADWPDCRAHVIAQSVARIGTEQRAPMTRVQTRSAKSPYQRAVSAEQSANLGAALIVRADDRRATFTALRNLALDWLRARIAQCEREQLESDEQREQRAEQRTLSLAEQIAREREQQRAACEQSPERAAALSDDIAHALSRAPHSVADGRQYANLWRLIYHAARGAQSTAISAADLECERSALEQSMSRARRAVAQRYGSADALLAALCDLTGLSVDGSSAASAPSKHATAWSARDWRESDGSAPVSERRKPGARRKSRPMTDEQRAESLTRRARAERATISRR